MDSESKKRCSHSSRYNGNFYISRMTVLTLTACWSTFWKSKFKQQLGCRFDIIDNISYFCVFWHLQLYMSWYIRSFFGFTFLNILYFFKYSCTNILHRRSLYTFYSIEMFPLDYTILLIGYVIRDSPIAWKQCIHIYVDVCHSFDWYHHTHYIMEWTQFQDTAGHTIYHGCDLWPWWIYYVCTAESMLKIFIMYIDIIWLWRVRIASLRNLIQLKSYWRGKKKKIQQVIIGRW